MRETWVRSLSWEDPLEKGKATHSSILAWKIPWTIQSMESQRIRHDWVTFTFTFKECISLDRMKVPDCTLGEEGACSLPSGPPPLDWLVEELTRRAQGWCMVARCACLTFVKWQVHLVALSSPYYNLVCSINGKNQKHFACIDYLGQQYSHLGSLKETFTMKPLLSILLQLSRLSKFHLSPPVHDQIIPFQLLRGSRLINCS